MARSRVPGAPDGPGRLLIGADRSKWWAPLLQWAVVCALLGLILGAVVWFDTRDGATSAGMLLIAAVAAILGGLAQSLWWLLGPARTRYVVHDGHLIVERGHRHVHAIPCAAITDLHMEGDPLTWPRLLFERLLTLRVFTLQFAHTPRLWVEADTWDRPGLLVGPRAMPQILLWGEDRPTRVAAQLNAAVTHEREDEHP